MSLEDSSSKNLLSSCCKVSFILNLLTICFAIAYFSLLASYSFLLDIFGIILVGSWLLNVFILVLVDKHVIKSTPIGKFINRFSYYYIFFFMLALFLILIGILLSLLVVDITQALFVIWIYLVEMFGLIGIAGLGIYQSVIVNTRLNIRGVWHFE